MHFIILTLLAVIGATVGLQLPAKLEPSVQFISREELAKFQKNNPDVVLKPLHRETKDTTITYTIGSRVSGDRLVAISSDYLYWGFPQDVQLTLQYPTSGVGSVVTYAIVVVQQSSIYGQGYIVEGGIGYRSITVLIEAYETTFLSYAAEIYGI